MASLARSVLLRQSILAATRPSPVVTRTALLPAMRREAFKRASIAAFHTTTKRELLPPGPQVIQGGVNDPVPVPEAHPSHGSYHWTFERLLAAGLVPLTAAPFAAGTLNPTMDAVLCAALLVHSHMGFQTIIVDYVPTKRYPGLRKLLMWTLNAATVVVGIALYEFETNDVGVTEGIKRIWVA